MCLGISLAIHELPIPLVEKLQQRTIQRDVDAVREIRFLYVEKPAILPVWHDGQKKIYRWGNGGRKDLPGGGWCRQESLEAGHWQHLRPELVEIPADYARQGQIWFQVPSSIQGLLIRDSQRQAHVYMLTKPASHYYHVMTRSPRMPQFMGEDI